MCVRVYDRTLLHGEQCSGTYQRDSHETATVPLESCSAPVGMNASVCVLVCPKNLGYQVPPLIRGPVNNIVGGMKVPSVLSVPYLMMVQTIRRK